MARVFELERPTIGNWAAVDEAMVTDYYEGRFEPTVVIMDWPLEPPSISIGIHEDGDLVNTNRAREMGFHVGRRYGYGGSVGVYGPGIPLFTLYLGADGDHTLDSISRTSGEEIVAVLESYGVDAVYDHIGDVKFVVDDTQYKAVANAPAYLHDGIWSVTVSVIWDNPPAHTEEVLDAAVRVPPEKFEDKDEKTVTGRMKPLAQQFDQFGSEVSKREFLDEAIEHHVDAFVGGDEPIESTTPDRLLDYVEAATPFFESDSWVDRRATSRLCQAHDPGDTVGVAAYKSRKLLKASVILDEGRITDALVTGDFFIRPHPTVTAEGAPHLFDEALIGCDATDRAELERAIQGVFDRPDFEMPCVAIEDVVETISHAAENTMTVETYLADHA